MIKNFTTVKIITIMSDANMETKLCSKCSGDNKHPYSYSIFGASMFIFYRTVSSRVLMSHNMYMYVLYQNIGT